MVPGASHQQSQILPFVSGMNDPFTSVNLSLEANFWADAAHEGQLWHGMKNAGYVMGWLGVHLVLIFYQLILEET